MAFFKFRWPGQSEQAPAERPSKRARAPQAESIDVMRRRARHRLIGAAVHLINREKAVVVDVCEADEFAAGHVNGAKNVPLSQLEEKLPTAVKNKQLPLVLLCATGARAVRAEAIAKKLGYEKAQALSGGMKAWREAGLPVEKA